MQMENASFVRLSSPSHQTLFPHPLIFFLSPRSSFRLSPRSLKQWKLQWWLANLSEINLMGSAFARLPRGCAFTAVLLIYSWKTALQCPSIAERCGQPRIFFFFFAWVLRHLFLCTLYFSLQISLLSPSLSEQLTSSKVAKPELQATRYCVWDSDSAEVLQDNFQGIISATFNHDSFFFPADIPLLPFRLTYWSTHRFGNCIVHPMQIKLRPAAWLSPAAYQKVSW